MLEGVWGRTSSLAVPGIATGPAVVEISMENSQKIKRNLPYDPAILLLGMCSKGWNAVPQILAQPRSLLPRSQKRGDRNNPDVLQLMDAEQKWVQYTTEYSSPGKKMKLWDLKRSMDGTSKGHIVWGNPAAERQRSHVLSFHLHSVTPSSCPTSFSQLSLKPSARIQTYAFPERGLSNQR